MDDSVPAVVLRLFDRKDMFSSLEPMELRELRRGVVGRLAPPYPALIGERLRGVGATRLTRPDIMMPNADCCMPSAKKNMTSAKYT